MLLSAGTQHVQRRTDKDKVSRSLFSRRITMQADVRNVPTGFSTGRLLRAAAALGLMSLLAFAPAALAQTGSSSALQFGNNYFVTGDYVVGGVGLRGKGVNGFATGTINIPDANPGIQGPKAVPAGAQIVAALLYWQTVESSRTTFAGQNGFFRAVYPGGPATGFPITGLLLGNPNAPVSWSSGGCSGDAQGSKTMRVYRADVRPYLRVDADGNMLPNGSYEVRLADSGSSGAGAPLTLGATLVIIYRVLSQDFPLNSVVIYDGAFSPSNSSTTFSQSMQGFYQVATSRISKLTHIVGNGQDKKFQTVYWNNVALPSLYPKLPAFPGHYNGSWDNPTWSFTGNGNPMQENDPSTATSVVPAKTAKGCVSWGAIIVGTTVQDSDNDGLIDVWEQNQGYCDASVNGGVCSSTDSSWVTLPGAAPNQKDIFVQADYMCGGTLTGSGVCDLSSGGHSHFPIPEGMTKLTAAFASRGINLHLQITNPIQEETCSDNLSATPVALCAFPGKPGVVGWKAGFNFLKNQLIDKDSKQVCDVSGSTENCIRRFQHGRKHSYHYAIFGHAVGLPEWGFQAKNLLSIEAAGNTVTFTTSAPHGLILGSPATPEDQKPRSRVTVGDATSNFGLNGTYFVSSTPAPNQFTIQIATPVNAVYTPSTDPWISVASGRVRSGSGFSDVGGADTLMSLGLWGVVGETWQVQAGTLMHELGHSLGLTHGGFFFPNAPASYVPAIEANCKPNFQSVMNYFFQVDLLHNNLGEQVLDYSGVVLNTLDELALTGVEGVTPSPTPYALTKWYTPVFPGVGTAATRFCDGRPLTGSEPPMYRLQGVTNPILPAWSNGHDINFNGKADFVGGAGNLGLRGYNDWANLDLRQIGATGSDTLGGGGSFGFGAGSFGFGAGSFGFGAGTFGFGAGSFGFGAGTFGFGAGSFGFGAGTFGFGAGSFGFGAGSFGFGAGTGESELTFEAASSAARPPRNLRASLLQSPDRIRLDWDAPTFGQVLEYRIYRGVNSDPVTTAPYAVVPGSATLFFVDNQLVCGAVHKYFVTAMMPNLENPDNPLQSVPSNTVSETAPECVYTFTGFFSPLAMTTATAGTVSPSCSPGSFTLGRAVPIKFQLRDPQGNLVTSVDAISNILRIAALRTSQCPGVGGTELSPPLYVCDSASGTCGATGGSTFRFDSNNNQFIFNWDTANVAQPGFYTIVVTLQDARNTTAATTIQLK
jgi:hypothetical protein